MRLIRAFTASCCLAACAVATASATAGERPIVRVASVSQFAATPHPSSAIVNGYSTGSGPAGHPYFLRKAGGGSDDHDASLGFIGFSSLPIESSMDPRPNRGQRLVYSECVAEAGTTTCGLLAQSLTSPAIRPERVTDSVTGAKDRLPSTYGDATVFLRTPAGERSGHLRLAPSIGAPSQPLPGGPQGSGTATATGIGLRDRDVAYVWRWTTSSGVVRNALRSHRIGGSTTTLVSMPIRRGVLIGPSWQGSRLIFGVRTRSGASTWYRYDPRTHRYMSAKAPGALAAVTATRRFLYWETAGASALDTGLCRSPGCALNLSNPRFRSARAPT
jgi:hypothetical protein